MAAAAAVFLFVSLFVFCPSILCVCVFFCVLFARPLYIEGPWGGCVLCQSTLKTDAQNRQSISTTNHETNTTRPIAPWSTPSTPTRRHGPRRPDTAAHSPRSASVSTTVRGGFSTTPLLVNLSQARLEVPGSVSGMPIARWVEVRKCKAIPTPPRGARHFLHTHMGPNMTYAIVEPLRQRGHQADARNIWFAVCGSTLLDWIFFAKEDSMQKIFFFSQS